MESTSLPPDTAVLENDIDLTNLETADSLAERLVQMGDHVPDLVKNGTMHGHVDHFVKHVGH